MKLKIWQIIGLTLLSLGFLTWAILQFFQETPFIIAFLDTGAEPAVFIQSPAGIHVLINTGDGTAVLPQLAKLMPFYERSIDMVFLTNTADSFTGGLPDILKKYAVGSFITSGQLSTSSVLNESNTLLKEKSIRQIVVRRGMRFDLGKETTLEILFPNRDVHNVSQDTASVVLKVCYKVNCFLLADRSPLSVQNYLADLSSTAMRATIVMTHYVNLQTSVAEKVMKAINPKLVIISGITKKKDDPKNNDQFALLKKENIPFLETGNGAVIIFKDDSPAPVLMR